MIKNLDKFSSNEDKFSYLSLFYQNIDDNYEEFKNLINDINWSKLLAQGFSNHLFGFYYRVFKLLRHENIPKDISRGCRNHYFYNDMKINLYSKEIGILHDILQNNNIDYVLTRGYVYYSLLYNNLPIREFSDIDVYIKRSNIEKTIECLSKAGYICESNAKDRLKYFLDHHIHIRVENPENKIVFEIHWAVDHKYNLMDLPIDALLDERRYVELNSQEMCIPSIENDLILSSVHVLKHSPMIKYAHGEEDYFNMLFSENYSVKFFDLYLLINKYEKSIDWVKIIELSRSYFCEEYLHTVLKMLKTVFDAPIRNDCIDELFPYKPGIIEKKIANYLVNRRSSQNGNGVFRRFFQKIIDKCKKSLVFNPIRMIDLFRYLYPPKRYLKFLKDKNVCYFKRNRVYLFLRGLLLLGKNLIDAIFGNHDLLSDD